MRSYITAILKRGLSTVKIKPKICIVGAGPAGFYAAQHLLKKIKDTEIDIYERLPVPFGLVRYGVAPDHPEVKNVINTFSKTAENPNVRFVGNVQLGKDVSLRQLKEAYHIVLLSYGADENRYLSIPGEKLDNIIPAKNIVGWYNGIPWNSNLKIDLSGEIVAILGQGNVAIDVARILLTPVDKLKETDITEHSLEILSKSKIKEVTLIGRRGPLQVAFTIKELRELLNLHNCTTTWCLEDFNGVGECISSLARPRKRLTELMLSSSSSSKAADKLENPLSKKLRPIFCRSPLQFTGINNKVDKIVLGVNELEGDDLLNKRATLTKTKEEMPCDLVVTSIGYKSVQADGNIPFDFVRGIVESINGRVEKGLYVTGWLATGPTGVILTTMSNAFAVTEEILIDIKTENLVNNNTGGFDDIKQILDSKNVQLVTWAGWLKIDKYEQELGKQCGKPREKVVDILHMLKIAA